MVRDITTRPIADQPLISGDDAHSPSMRARRAATPVPLVAYTCPVRPGHAWVDWTMYDSAVILIAHITEWTPQQAVDLVARALGRPIVLGEVAQ